MKFKDINLSDETKRALAEIGYDEMTEIQEKSIPIIMKGRDIIGQSKTGTGKTASYSLPIIEMIDSEDRNVQAIILCPTRELATQVTAEIRKFLKYKASIKTVCIYGGQSMQNQIRELKGGAQIIVGTPGRVMDHMRRKTIRLANTKIVVLDEADEMLDMGFEEDMETILKEVNPDRQTLLFSATMSKRILKITEKYLKNPENVIIKSKELTVDSIKQIALEMKSSMKDETVVRLLDMYNPTKALIFCNTKRKVDNLIEVLQKKGYSVDSIHGDKSQDQRERIMKKFKKGDLKILIATDVAARGIDVENLELVINYDIPQEAEYYVHRIGRTGRNGKGGIAFTFVVGKEKSKIFNIEKFAKTKLENGKIPSLGEVEKIRNEKKIEEIQKIIDSYSEKELSKDEDSLFQKLLKNNNNDSEKIAKALLSTLINRNYQEEKEENDNTSTKEIAIEDACFDDEGNIKLFLNLGKKDNIMVKDIVGGITGNTGMSGNDIGNIKLLENFSFVSIPEKYVKEVMKKMNGNKIKGKDVNFEIARN